MYYRLWDRYRPFNDRRSRSYPFRFHWEDNEIPFLAIVSVDMCIKVNGAAHRTRRYDLMNRVNGDRNLVIRRGQAFHLDLTLSRDYDFSSDGLSIVFTLDGMKKQNEKRGISYITVPLLNSGNVSEGSWQATVDSLDTNSMRIKIVSPADTLIGKWRIDIDSNRKNHRGAISFAVPEPLYIIFNAWCKDDSVYLDDEEKRQEYVLLDSGLIWRGIGKDPRPTNWEYAQYEKDILDCAIFMMNEIGKTRLTSRGDPIAICRNLSAAVNSPDDSGALEGNWSNDFTGGKPATYWQGSQLILQQFYKTRKPVKFGQCWVFAGVLTTVCRALGIPSRVVTNYLSAHDTQGSLTVDYVIDEKGDQVESLCTDSIWNFHVWSEVWMTRPDLGADCDGWQVIDATPQEMSDEMYRCGPASVKAVKNGDVRRPYDNSFIFAEVNADTLYWRYNGPTQPLKLLHKISDSIGQSISTKAVGKWEREDITLEYKYPEQSDSERDAMLRALRQSSSHFSRYYLNDHFNELQFEFLLLDDILIGQPFSVTLLMKNNSPEWEYGVSVKLQVDVVSYTGKVGDRVMKLESDLSVRPGDVEPLRLNLSWNDYGTKLLDQCTFKISCLAAVQNTDFEYYAEDDFRVKKPDIQIECETEPRVGEELRGTAKFTNPLPIPLRRGTFHIVGPGRELPTKIRLLGDVGPGQDAVCQFQMYPHLPGRATIAAKFRSIELDDVEGFVISTVKSNRGRRPIAYEYY